MTVSEPIFLSGVVRRPSLREQVGESLRTSLVSGQLTPGEVYSAPMLAAQFGVSATPVREAMLDLAREGLVEVVRNKGFRVTEVAEHELDSMAELRALVEIPVMASIAAACTGPVADAVEDLRPVAQDIIDAAKDKDLQRYVLKDTEFHLRFLALHGNATIVEIIRELRGRARLYGLSELARAGVLSESAREHLRIVDAALDQDAEEMTLLMTSHIGHVRKLWAGRSEPR